MPITLVVNGQTFEYPEQGDNAWGASATNWAVAVTDGMLQKAGGTFSLLSDANFGPTFGLVSPYFKSETSNIAATGILRLANTDVIAWRNGANSADVTMGIDTSGNLIFSGNKHILPSDINNGTNANSTTFLRGDGVWIAPSGSGSVNAATAANQIAFYTSATNAVFANSNITATSGGTLTAVALVGPLTGNVTGDISGNAATVTTNANMTGPITGTGNVTSITAQTGTGTTFVMDTSPTLVTPAIGAATATTPTTGDNSTNVATTAFVQTTVSSAVAFAVPTGTMLEFAANRAPTGYLICDGSAVSRTTYTNLFNVIGTIYGAGNGTTTFNVPNCLGIFTRGFDSSGVVDPSRTFGSTQAGAIQGHNHTATSAVSDPGHHHSTTAWAFGFGSSGAPAGSSLGQGVITSTTSGTGITVGTTIGNTGGSETRPINIAVTKIIKY